MAYKWVQWLKDYNDNKIKLCVPVGYSAQEAADDPDNSIYLTYQGWQPPSYTHWDIFPLHIAIAENCVNYARNNGCEDVVRYLSSFGVGAELQYHFKSNETITSRCNSVDYLGYSCSFFQPSAGLDVYSYSSYINTNPDNIAYYSYPAIAIDEDSHRAIFAAITVTKTYSDPDPSGSVNIEILTRTDAARATFYNKILTSIPPVPADPYNAGGNSNEQLDTGPSTGDFDDTSDVISIPSAPTLNLAACQMINVYVPSLTDVQNLAQYLWSNFDLHDMNNTLSKVFTDPINAILSLHILPFTPSSSTAITVTFGGYATSVQIPPASEQFHDVDCGSLSFSEFWGNYLDYNPYTRITACLPFVGQVDIDPDEVMGKKVKIKYRVDIVTGAFVCFLYIDGEKVLGQYAGNMAQQVPVSAADYSRLNAAILGVAATAATGFGIAAAGGFSSPERKEDGGLTITGGGANMSALGHFAGSVIGSGVDNILNAKVRVAHSGGLSGSPGIMGLLKPYVIIHRARQSVPPDANKFKGYPCNATFKLSDLEGCGFTSVRSIKLDGLKLSDGELGELRGILAGGVYL